MDRSLNKKKDQVGSNTTIEVGLVSDVSCLQNALLIERLEEELNVACRVITENRAADCRCLLLDCNNLSPDEIRNLMKKIADEEGSDESPALIVLINATPFGPHEALVEWVGLNGIFFHCTDQQQLVYGIKQILAGELWLPRRILCNFLISKRRSLSGKHLDVSLTRREKQILYYIQQGITNRGISSQLYVSENTIKSHLYNIFKKIGVKNRQSASNWAREYLDV